MVTWPRSTPYLIAEIGVNHDGSVERAGAMVRQAIAAGFDAVKFQHWRVEELLSDDVPNAGYQGEGDQRALLAALELTIDELSDLRAQVAQLGADFIVTPDGLGACDDVVALEPDALKIGSGDADNPLLVEAAIESGLPLIVSTGMFEDEQLEGLRDVLGRSSRLAVLHCVSAYPTPLAEARLDRLATLRRLGFPVVGFSDHTLGIAAAAASVALGAAVLEKHVTWSVDAPGPDHAASLELSAAADWVRDVRDVAVAVTGGRRSAEELENRKVVRKALYASRPLARGRALEAADVALLRPLLDGIPAPALPGVLGRRLARDVAAGTRLRMEDLEPEPPA